MSRSATSGAGPSADVGLLLLRLALAVSFVGHGAQKVFGAFGGTGIDGFADGTLRHYGFRFPEVLAWVTGLTELVGGALVGVGLLTPLAATGLMAVMVNSVLLKFHNGFFFQLPGGYEVDFLLLGLAAGVVLAGPGAISVDASGRFARVLGVRWAFLLLGLASGLVFYVALRS